MEAAAFTAWLANPLSLMSLGALGAAFVWSILGALRAGASAYAGKKGENLATKEDLADAIEHLKKFEGVRMEVAHNDWIAREWKTVRVRNLEVVAGRLQENYAQAQAYCDSCMRGLVPKGVSEPPAEVALKSLQKLYYPELERPVAVLLQGCVRLRALSMTYGKIVADMPTQPDQAWYAKLGAAGDATLNGVGDLKDAADTAVEAVTALSRQLFAVEQSHGTGSGEAPP